MEINKTTLNYVAHLARIELQEKELDKLSSQLQSILNFIDKLKELDVKDISPTSHILPINNCFREDLPLDSLQNDVVLNNAPQKKDKFFEVPKVIE